MTNHGDIDEVFKRKVEYVAGTKAVASYTDLGNALLLQHCENLVDRRACLSGAVLREPCHQVKVGLNCVNVCRVLG